MGEQIPPRRSQAERTQQRKQQIIQAAMRFFAQDGYHGARLADIAKAAGVSEPGLLHHFPSKAHLLMEVLAERDRLDRERFNPVPQDQTAVHARPPEPSSSVTALPNSTPDPSSKHPAAHTSPTEPSSAQPSVPITPSEPSSNQPSSIASPPEAFSPPLTLASLQELAAHNQRVPGLVQLFSVLVAESIDQQHPGHEFFRQRYEMLRRQSVPMIRQAQADGELRADLPAEDLAVLIFAMMDGLQIQWLYAPHSLDMASLFEQFLSLLKGNQTSAELVA